MFIDRKINKHAEKCKYFLYHDVGEKIHGLPDSKWLLTLATLGEITCADP